MNPYGLLGLRLPLDGSSSRQARYRLTWLAEGVAVGKMVEWRGDVGRLVAVGTPIRITRRIIAKGSVIRRYDCVIQYKSGFKTER